MAIFSKKICKIVAFGAALPLVASSVLAMGGKLNFASIQNKRIDVQSDKIPEAKITLAELAHIYWPDSNATQMQLNCNKRR